MATEPLSHSQSMIRLFMGYIPTRVIYVAAKLGLADHIRDDGATAQDLAQTLKVHPDALYRVMRTLAGLGVLRQDENDRFFVTPFGETLRKDSPNSVRDYAIYSHEFSYHRLSKIMDSVRTGKPVMENFFENLRANPEQEAIRLAGSGNKSRIETVAIIEAYDFSKCGKLVDVGGGNGASPRVPVRCSPHLHHLQQAAFVRPVLPLAHAVAFGVRCCRRRPQLHRSRQSQVPTAVILVGLLPLHCPWRRPHPGLGHCG